MKIVLALFSAFVLLSSAPVHAADDLPSSISVTLAQDPFFGFYPMVNGSFGLSEKSSLTFYGIFWTQAYLGRYEGKPGDGLNLMTEFGVGMNFVMADGAISINPQLGLTGGNFQSGGGRPVIGDAIAPSITASYTKDNVSLPLFLCVWKGLRKEHGPEVYLDQAQWTLTPSIALSPKVSVGLYLDQVFFGYEKQKDARPLLTQYFWTGPSLKFTVKSGASLWFSAGIDWAEFVSADPLITTADPKYRDYYKMMLNVSF